MMMLVISFFCLLVYCSVCLSAYPSEDLPLTPREFFGLLSEHHVDCWTSLLSEEDLDLPDADNFWLTDPMLDTRFSDDEPVDFRATVSNNRPIGHYGNDGLSEGFCPLPSSQSSDFSGEYYEVDEHGHETVILRHSNHDNGFQSPNLAAQLEHVNAEDDNADLRQANEEIDIQDLAIIAHYSIVDPLIAQDFQQSNRHLLDLTAVISVNITIAVLNIGDNYVANATYCYPKPSSNCNLRSAWLACAQLGLAAANRHMQPGLCTITLPFNATIYFNPMYSYLYLTNPMNVALLGNQAKIFQTPIDSSSTMRFVYYSNASSLCLNYVPVMPVVKISNMTFAKFGTPVTSGGVGFFKGKSRINIDHVVVTNSTAYYGAAFYFSLNTAGINIEDCAFSKLYGVQNAGAIYLASKLANVAIRRSNFSFSQSVFGGCLLTANGLTNLQFEDNTFTSCTVTKSGGAVYIGGSMTNVNFTRNTFTNNYASYGGGIYFYNGINVNVINNSFLGNSASISSGNGGAIMFSDSLNNLNISGNYFGNNQASFGGAISAQKGNNITVVDSYFYKNYAASGGSLFLNANFENVTISRCLFRQSSGLNYGGAIYFYSLATSVNLTSLAFYGCYLGSSGNGGAIAFYSFNQQIYIANISAYGIYTGYTGGLLLMGYNNTRVAVMNVTANTIGAMQSSSFGGLVSFFTNNSFCLFDGLQVRNFRANQGGVFNLNSNNSFLVIRNSSFINGRGGISGFVSMSNANNVTFANIYLYNITTPNNLITVLISNNSQFINMTAVSSSGFVKVTNSNNITLNHIYLQTLNKASAINFETNCQNISISNAVIKNCSATTGGGIYIGDKVINASIVDSIIDGNRASKQGGGVYIYKSSPRVSFVNVSITNNRATLGGGVFIGNGARQVLFSSKNTYQNLKIVESPHPYVSRQATNGVRYVISSANVTVSDASKFLLVFDEQTSIDDIDQIYIYSTYKKQTLLMAFNYQCIPGVDCPVVSIPGPSFYIELLGPTGSQILEPGYYGFKLYAYPIFVNDAKFKIIGNRAVTKGGGIHFDYATSFPLLLNMDISDNQVTNGPGGGLSFQIANSGAYFLNVDMTNNYAKYDGGAIAFLSGQYGVVMNNCNFYRNQADGNGGAHFFASSNGIGIFYSNNNITYNNCKFDGNSAKEDGGAIYAETENALLLTTCILTNNKALASGGGINAEELNFVNLVSSVVMNNVADVNGGGISATTRTSIVLSSTVVASNMAAKAGGGLFLETYSILMIQNKVKVINNQAGQIGGGVSFINTFWWNFFTTSARLTLSGNHAIRGSAVFVKSLLLSNRVTLGVATISNNTARGGTIYWIYDSTMRNQPPALTSTNTIIANNTAVFGVIAATQALKVLPPTSYVVTIYAANLQPAINVTLEDYYGQFVNITGGTTIYPTISSSKCTQYPYLAGENTLGDGVPMNNGIASFSSLQTYCSPEGNLTLKFTAKIAVQLGLPESIISPYYLKNTSFLTFRSCMAGEYESKGLCVICPESSYSLEPDSQECASCLSVAGIKTCGGSTIVVDPGYWRRTDQSTVVFACVLAPESCPGGYGTGDLSCGVGYEGSLCAVCSEGYYLNNNQCVSCEGTGKITATTWAVAAIAIVVFIVIGILYYQNYKMNKLLKANQPSKHADIEAGDDSDDEAENKTNQNEKEDDEEGGDDEDDEDDEYALEKSTIHLDYSTTSQLTTLQLVMLWVKLKYSELMVKIKIIVSTFQVVTSTASIFSVSLPREFTSFVNVFKVFHLSITSIIPLACENNYSFVDTLLWTTLTPIVLASLLLLAFLLEYTYVRYKIQSQVQRKKGAKQQAFNACKDKYLNYFFYLTYLVLPSVSTTIFQTFVCTNVDPKSEDDYTYDWFLNADMSISCQTNYYYSWVSYAVVMVFIYPIGIPSFYLYVLYLNRAEIAAREADTALPTIAEEGVVVEMTDTNAATSNPLHRMSTGSRSNSRENGMNVADTNGARLNVTESIIAKQGPRKMSGSAARLAFLWQAYLPTYWYWEVVESTRRIMLTAVLSVTSPGSSKQSVFGVILAFCYIVLYSTYKPYNEASDATLGETGQIQIFLTFFAALVIQNNLMSTTWDTFLGAMLTLVNLLVIGLTCYFEIAAYQTERKEAEAQAEEERKKTANDRIAAHLASNLTKQNPSKTMSMRFERKTEAELLDVIAMEEKLGSRLSRKLKKADPKMLSKLNFDEDNRGSTVGVELQEWRPKAQEASTATGPPVFTRNPSLTVNASAAPVSTVTNAATDAGATETETNQLRLSISEKYRNSRGETFRASVLDYKDSDDEDD